MWWCYDWSRYIYTILIVRLCSQYLTWCLSVYFPLSHSRTPPFWVYSISMSVFMSPEAADEGTVGRVVTLSKRSFRSGSGDDDSVGEFLLR